MRREGVCENLDVRKNRNSKFSHRSLVMLFQFYFYYKIEYFYREKPYTLMLFRHIKVQITTRGQLSGFNCPWVRS